MNCRQYVQIDGRTQWAKSAKYYNSVEVIYTERQTHTHTQTCTAMHRHAQPCTEVERLLFHWPK